MMMDAGQGQPQGQNQGQDQGQQEQVKQAVMQVVQMLQQGVSPEELKSKGVPEEIIQMAMQILAQQRQQAPAAQEPQEGLAAQGLR